MKCLKATSIVCLSLLLANCALFPKNDEQAPTEISERPTASESTTASRAEQIPSSKAEKVYATVFFLRSSVVASAVSALLYEVVDGGLSLIGNIENNIQLSHKVSPGEHIFMLISGNSVDYVQVSASGDSTYYSLVKPKMGAWKPSFSFFPIKSKLQAEETPKDGDIFFGDEEVKNILSAGLPVVTSPSLPEGLSENEEALVKHREGWQALGQSAEGLASLKSLEAAPSPLP